MFRPSPFTRVSTRWTTGLVIACAGLVLAGMTFAPATSPAPNPHAQYYASDSFDLAALDGLDDHEEAKKMFNAVYGCAHCHGTNAVGSEYKTDLRYVVERYGEEEAPKVIDTTIRNGRDGTAMPTWGPIIPDEKIEKLKAFILSVQITDESK